MTLTDTVESAHAAAIRWLSRGEHSASAVQDRLVKAGHEVTVAKTVVERMVGDGTINDVRCAETLVHSWTRSAPLAPDELRRRLADRGIHGETAMTVIEAATSGDVLDMALHAAEKKFRTLGTLPHDAAARRIAGYLGRRGFDEDTTHAVLERLGLASANE